MDFSNPTDRNGIIEFIEKYTKTQSVTSSSYPLKVKTQDVNDSFSKFAMIAIQNSGRMQWDDTNQADYPVITFDLISGQDNYAYTVDGATPANQILDLHQVRIKDSSGNWKLLTPIDRQTTDISQYQNVTGTPTTYDVNANGIIFYPTPNYNSTGGGEITVSRTPSYFLSTDTTKQAGIPKVFHPYLYLRPSYLYCVVNNLPQAKALAVEVAAMEKAIADYYSKRVRIERGGLRVNRSDSNR